jgi:hypothetical protein
MISLPNFLNKRGQVRIQKAKAALKFSNSLIENDRLQRTFQPLQKQSKYTTNKRLQ